MKRISTATKVSDKFGAGKHGFTNGNAVAGVPATDLEDAWFDHVQEEIANVIEAGGIAIDAASRSQLLTALRSAGVFQTPATGDRSTKVATTQMFANEFAASLGGSGHQKIAGGFILQWGQASSSSSADTTVTFPIAFPIACYGVFLTPNSNGAAFGTFFSESLANFLMNCWTTGGARSVINMRWWAIGK
jgi:hypothetical protein